MSKDEIEYVLKNNGYIKNGTKEACIKVKDFVKNIQSIESKSSIDCKEFLDAINTLLAFSFRAKDTIPERWCCDNDCIYTNFMTCPGEFNVSKDSKDLKICPYYIPEM